ncbi:MAG: TonB-dependent receptor, partial [Acidobacteria bacterium]|nr:TonB-dependent receptor [Acidobacteriota bacterium]
LIPGLLQGTYSAEVSAQGFTTESVTGIELLVAGNTTVNFLLSEASATFKATAQALPPATDRELPSVGLVIGRDFVENLPLNGRSFQSLIELTPGVVITNSTTVSAGQFSVNGQRTNSNYFMIDGVGGNVGASAVATFSQQAAGTLPGLTVLGGTNSLVTLDALQEFRIQTSTFAPEFGRTPGAQVSLATRSGSNQFHGSLFYELRNEKLDANDWFANAVGSSRAPFRLNQFGATLSGPVTIPKIYSGKNRTFFFAAYEGLRLRQPRFQTVQVPTDSARRRATGAIQSLLNAFPLPNAPSPFTNPDEGLFRAAFSDPATTNITSLRLDHNLTSKALLFGRLSVSPTERTERVFANQITTTRSNLYTYTTGLNLTITPRLIHEFRFNYSDSDAGFNWDAGEFAGAIKPQDSLLFPAYTDRNRASAGFFLGVFLPGISPPNLTQGRSIGNRQKQLNFTGNLSYTASSHQFKFGFDIRPMLPTAAFREYGVSYNFGSISNAINLGTATVSLQSLAPQASMDFPTYSFFAQDNWRVSPKLTINYGLRWELIPPPSGRSGRPIFGPTQVTDPLTLTIAPSGSSLWQTRWAASTAGPTTPSAPASTRHSPQVPQPLSQSPSTLKPPTAPISSSQIPTSNSRSRSTGALASRKNSVKSGPSMCAMSQTAAPNSSSMNS